jgi:Acetyltransferase (GNAT) domain
MTDRSRTASRFDAVVPAPRDEWDDLVRQSGHALAFQTPDWIDAICRVAPYRDASRLYRLAHGRRLVLPMVVSHRLMGRALSTAASLPYGWGFGGVVATDAITPADVTIVLRDLARRSFLRTSIRPDPLQASTWAAEGASARAQRVQRRAHILRLDGGWEATWSGRFTGSARTAVRKAERSGLMVESGNSPQLMDEFYDLYRQSMVRWSRSSPLPSGVARWRAAHLEPARKFRAVAEQLGDACRVWVASHQGRPAAAILVLTQGVHASYWRGAMDEGVAGPTRANYLLHRAAVEAACERGCRFYHMGETGRSASLAQFKTRFGAEPYDYFEYRLERLPMTPVVDGLIRLAGGVVSRWSK